MLSLAFFLILFLSLSLFFPTIYSSSSSSSPPNIVVLMADDLGFADVGYHGLRPDVKTPNIDKLSKHGVILRNFYSHPMCMPARGAFLTGRSPWTYGVTRESIFPLPNTPLLSELLRSHGYTTTMIGKWDLRPRGNSKDFSGFDETFHHVTSNSYINTRIYKGNRPRLSLNETYLTTACGDEAARYIRAHQQQQKQTHKEKHEDSSSAKKPFFMWFAPLAPHIPWQAPEEYVNQFLHVQDPLRKMYLATLKALDDEIGKIMDTLETTNQLKNTLVVFLSDNGGLWEHAVHNHPYRGGKLMPTEGGLRVPALFYWPKMLRQGGIYLPEFTMEDLHETLIEAAGMSHPHPHPARRGHWADLIQETMRQADFPAPLGNPIAHVMNRDFVQDISCYSAATRTGKYKLLIQNTDCVSVGDSVDPSLIRYDAFPTDQNHTFALYDLAVDPTEQEDLLKIPERKESPEVQGALETLWRLYRSGVKETKAAYGSKPPKIMLKNLFCRDRKQQEDVHVTKTWRFHFTNINTKTILAANRTGAQPDEFSQLVESRKPIGFWKFNKQAPLIDSSQSKNHLVAVSDEMVSCGLNPRLGAPDNGALTSFFQHGLPSKNQIEFGAASTFHAVFVLPDFESTRSLFCLSPTNSGIGCEIHAQIRDDGTLVIFIGAAVVLETSQGVCPRNILVDVAVVFDQGKITAFVNGEQAGEGSGSLPPRALFLILGIWNFDLLDEFVIYDRALSPAEILEHQIPLGTVEPTWFQSLRQTVAPEEDSYEPQTNEPKESEVASEPAESTSPSESFEPPEVRADFDLPPTEPSKDLKEPSPSPSPPPRPEETNSYSDIWSANRRLQTNIHPTTEIHPLMYLFGASSLGLTLIGFLKLTRRIIR